MENAERFVDDDMDWLSGDDEFLAELIRQGLNDDFEDDADGE